MNFADNSMKTEWKLFGAVLIISVVITGALFGFVSLTKQEKQQVVVPTPTPVTGELMVRGQATDIDRTQMFVDGDGILKVTTDKGEIFTILIPARERLCEADISSFSYLTIGSEVEVFGSFVNAETTLCESSNHYLKIVGDLEVDTSDWQTYQNEQFGFEIKYPTEWTFDTPQIREEEPYLIIGLETITPDSVSVGFQMSVYDSDPDDSDPYTQCTKTGETIVVSGKEYEKCLYLVGEGALAGWYLTIVNKGFIYDFEVDDSDIPDQVISTFRFIESIDTSDWQTYRNEEFGFAFEVEYPKWWTTDYHNIFNSNDPYEPYAGGFLKSDVMKAQFQYHSFSSIKSKQELLDMLVKNQDVLKEGSRPSPFGPIDTESFTSVTNDYGLEIIKFTQSYAYAGQIGYIIPGKSDFSEMIYVVVWNLDPLFENVLSTFRFIDDQPLSLSDDVSFCPESYSLAWAFSIRHAADQEAGKLIVCDQPYPGENRTIHVVDAKRNEVWKSGFNSHIYEGPKVLDIENDGVDEIYWAFFNCGGTCTGCGTSLQIHSFKLNEDFFRTDRQEPKSSKECGILIDQPPVFSSNLESSEYQVFKEFLETKKVDLDNIYGSG